MLSRSEKAQRFAIALSSLTLIHFYELTDFRKIIHGRPRSDGYHIFVHPLPSHKV